MIGLANSLANLGHSISIFTPEMSLRQKKYIGVPFTPLWNLVDTKGFPMIYRRFPGYSRILRKLLSTTFEMFTKIRISLSKRKIPRFIESSAWEDEHQDWYPYLYPLFKNLHSQDSFDFVISSSSPFSTHKIASLLSQEFSIKWVADYRDLWSQNYIQSGGPTLDQEQYEIKILENCTAATTVSSETRYLLSKIYSGPIEIIYNGYLSKQEFNPKTIQEEFVVLYVGGIYLASQDLEEFLRTVTEHNKTTGVNIHVKIQFLGDSAITVAKLYNSWKLDVPDWINLIKAVSRTESYNLQSKADALLMLEWNDNSQKGILRTKMFEYLSTLKPIISYGGSFDESYVIQRDAGTSIFLQNSQELSAFLSSLRLNEHLELSPNLEYISQFSYQYQGKRLSNFLESLGAQK